MTSWYRELPVPRPKSERIRRASKADRAKQRSRKPVRIRNGKHVYLSRYCRTIYINGIGVKVCTRNDIAKYFDIQHSTVARWDDKGLLPEPFYHVQSTRGAAPVYLATQVYVLWRVLRDLVRHGYVTIPWHSLPDHVEMLKDGYEAKAKVAYAKFNRVEEIEQPDAFGVVFHS